MISLVYPFYNNYKMLEYQHGKWLNWSDEVKNNVNIILVDDGSSKQVKIDGSELNLSHYKILEDIRWNVSGAKNLGVWGSKDSWVLCTDIDREIPQDLLIKCVKTSKINPAKVSFVFKEKYHDGKNVKRFHMGTIFLRRQDYWRVGGYDEDFSGAYGHEDGNFLKKLKNLGIVTRILEDEIIRHDRNPELPDACAPEEEYYDRHDNGSLSNQKDGKIPQSLDILRFNWKLENVWIRSS
jgi:hypothetical protein